MSIVAMGRFGGHELSYGSDADVMFVHDPLPGATEKAATDFATQVATELRRLLALPGADPAVAIDADLRPEGRQGPLVRTLASYASYYARWSAVWEAQALLRADPLCGDAELCKAFRELIDPLRYPADGIQERDVMEIRRIKARVDAERLPRGADPATHTKLGRGGLADIEWTVQLLQMREAHRVPGCGRRGRSAHCGPRSTAGWSRRPTPKSWPRLGDGDPDPQRDHARPRPPRRLAPTRPPRPRRGRPDLRLPPGETSRFSDDYLRTPAAPATPSTTSSGATARHNPQDLGGWRRWIRFGRRGCSAMSGGVSG